MVLGSTSNLFNVASEDLLECKLIIKPSETFLKFFFLDAFSIRASKLFEVNHKNHKKKLNKHHRKIAQTSTEN